MTPITKAIPPIIAKPATIPQISERPIQPAIDNATIRTTQVPQALKQNSDVVILLKFYGSFILNLYYTKLS